MSDSDFRVSTSWTGGEAVATPKQKSSRAHDVPARLARIPAQVLAFVSIVGWSFAYAPEFLSEDWILRTWEAVGLLSSIGPSQTPMDWSVNTMALGALLSATALALVAYTPVRQLLPVMLALAVVLSAFLVWNLAPYFARLSDYVPAVVLSLILAGIAVRAAALLRDTGPVGRIQVGWTPAVLLTLTLCIPLALGRRLAGVSVSNNIPSGILGPLLEYSGVWWTIALGGCAIFAVVAALHLIPPYSGRSVKGPVFILLLAAIGGTAYVLPNVHV